MNIETESKDLKLDAFSAGALSAFALNPDGARLFRLQHQKIISSLLSVISDSELLIEPTVHGTEARVNAVKARHKLTEVSVMLALHQQVEEESLRSVLSGEPRSRMLVDQAEREMGPIRAAMGSVLRRYQTPSSVLLAPREFSEACSSIMVKLEAQLKDEERDLFSLYDRATRSTSADSFRVPDSVVGSA